MKARAFVWGILLLLVVSQPGGAQTTTGGLPQPPLWPFEILFSVVTPFYFGGGVLQDGDVASDIQGRVVASNSALVKPFDPAPTYDAAGNLVAVDYGLDAVFELRCYPAPKSFVPVTLFSVKKGFYSQALKQQISDGDLLSSTGQVVAKNQTLLARFFPPTVSVPDLGLDAVFIPYYLPMAANPLPPEIWFSVARRYDYDDSTQNIHIHISDGDLLSSRGYVVARNRDLLRNFLVYPDIVPLPPEMDKGLDAVYVVRFRPWAVTAITSVLPQAPEIWFSVNKGFTDMHGRQISDGDLLSTSGAIVRKNSELLVNFPPSPLMGPDGVAMPVLLNYGLDAVYVRGRMLIASTPPGTTVPKVAGNVVRLVFDGSLEMPDSGALSLAAQAIPQGSAGALSLAGSTFDVAVATTNADTPGDTLVLTERGAAMSSASPYTIQPSDALDVEPFTLNITKLVGDINGDGSVNVGDLQQLVAGWGKADPASDLSGDNLVNVADLQLLVANWGR